VTLQWGEDVRTGHVEVRFYGELNDFLPPQRRQRSFVRRMDLPTTVTDLVEGLGVPHTEST
jgi:hypothetical protein